MYKTDMVYRANLLYLSLFQDGLAERLVDGLAESQQKIVPLISEKPKISKKEMSEQIGVSTTAIDKNINTLKDKKESDRWSNRWSDRWSDR